MAKTVTPFLMFEGDAESAMSLYASLFHDSKIMRVERHQTNENGEAGTILQAEAQIGGQTVKFFDSPIRHEFNFTPSFSFFVECETEEELSSAYSELSREGAVLMPPGDYGFSKQFCWVTDRFGVSWQLNLA